MTIKTPTRKPVEMAEKTMDQVQGGFVKYQDTMTTSVKDEPKRAKSSSFTADSFSFGVERE